MNSTLMPIGLLLGLYAAVCFVKRGSKIWIALAFFLSCILTLNLNPLSPPDTNPEASWVAVLTYAMSEPLQFGKDFIFTYGPLGFLVCAWYAGKLFTFTFFGRLAIQAIYFGLVFFYSKKFYPKYRFLFLIISFLSTQHQFGKFAYVLMLAGLICLESPNEKKDRIAFAVAAFSLSVFCLVKGNLLFLALIILGLVLLYHLLNKNWKLSTALFATFIISFLSLWLLMGQKLANIGAYLRGSFEISSGYSEAMSLWPKTSILILGILLAALCAIQLIQFLFKNSPDYKRCIFVFLILSASFFIEWKSGFVRADGHTADWFIFGGLIGAIIPLFFNPYSCFTKTQVFLGTAAFLLSISTIPYVLPGFYFGCKTIIASHWNHNLWNLTHPKAIAQIAKREVIQSRQKNAFTKIKNIIGPKTVDFIGFSQGILILNQLHYTPRPSFEGYSTYTSFLNARNIDFYRSPAAPQYVILQLHPIDYRFSALEESDILALLVQYYEPVFLEEDYLLLRKIAASPSGTILTSNHFDFIESKRLKLTDVCTLPNASAVWCKMDLRPTLIGKILNFLFQSPPVFIETVNSEKIVSLNRILPTIARNGFILSPAFSSTDEFLKALESPDKLTLQSIHIVPSVWLKWLFKPEVVYQFFRLPINATFSEKAREVKVASFSNMLTAAPLSMHSSLGEKGIQPVLIKNEHFLLVHPDGEIYFEIPDNAQSVHGKFAIRPEAWEAGKPNGVNFKVDYLPANSSQSITLFERYLDPLQEIKDRSICTFQIHLPNDAAKGRLILRTLPGPSQVAQWGWSCWSDIQFRYYDNFNKAPNF